MKRILVFGLYPPLSDGIVIRRMQNEISASLSLFPVATRLTDERVDCDDACLILSIRRGRPRTRGAVEPSGPAVVEGSGSAAVENSDPDPTGGVPRSARVPTLPRSLWHNVP